MAVYSALCKETAGLRGDFFDFDSIELCGIEGEYCSEDLPKGALIDESLDGVLIVGSHISQRQFLLWVLLWIIHAVGILGLGGTN